MIYQNPMAKYNCKETDGLSKGALFSRDLGRLMAARCSDGKMIPLSDIKDLAQVEFIGGIWRVQDDFPYKITTVRDRDFVVGELLDRHEQNRFEYYSARSVGYNCYGPFALSPTEIVACFNAGAVPLWAYGPSIEHARAFLAILLFDRNRDLIFKAEHENRTLVR